MDHLSYSQMNLYLHCPLKYKFNYVDRLPKPYKSSDLAFGSSLHSALGWLHKQRMNGNDIPVDRLYRVFTADWYAQKIGTSIQYKNGESETKLSIMTKEQLSLYFVKLHRKPVGIEVPFVLPLVNMTTREMLHVNLEGFIDLIEQDNTVTEFKTSAQTMNGDQINDHLQLTGYGYAYQMLYRRPPSLLKLVDFVKTKKPKIVTLHTDANKLDYQRFFYLVGKILRGIRSGIFFPRKGFMCKDCEYSNPCKAWRGD